MPRSLSNLVSSSTSPCVPWTFTLSPPENVKGKAGKPARSKWINDPSTEWQVYSLWEGLNENARITVGNRKEDTDGNPPFRLHGLVGDYDAALTEAELGAGVARCGAHPPTYYEKTLSGNARFLWLFQEPVTVPSREVAVALLKFAMTALRHRDMCVGLDEPAYLDPGRYYTNSGEWGEVSSHRLPADLVQGWIVEVVKKWKFKSEGVELPLPVVFEALKKKWPQMNWPADFTLDSQGPTFWVSESTSPKSAVVKPTGIYTFSGHAAKPFWSWSDLLGAEFVKEHEHKQMGAAVAGIYHDGQKYWMKDGTGVWRPFAKEDIREHIAINRGLDSERRAGPSAADKALDFIRTWQPIDGAAPFVYCGREIIELGGGKKALNTHVGRVFPPSEEKTVWGAGGKFPWLSAYFDALLDPVYPQKDYLLAWMKRFYGSAYNRDLDRGQTLFLVGGAGVGKTLFSQNILSKLMGGSADAQAYLTGDTNFNSHLFETPLMTIDDSSSTIDARTHAYFSSMLKKLVSNQTFEFSAKFRVAAQVQWLGRVVVTMNDDPESLRMIPDMEISAQEKHTLLRCARERKITFPPRREVENILVRELPYFARWLLDWEPPAEVISPDHRYGVRAYHEPSLFREAQHSSRSNGFSEVMQDWAETWFHDHPTEKSWSGTAYQFLKLLSSEEASRAALRSLTADVVGRNLAALKGKGWPITCDEKSGRVWTISNPKNRG